MLPPDSRPDLPTFTVKSTTIVRVHLGFRVKTISVSINKTPVRASLDGTRRIVSWRATRGGILTVSGRAASDASYVARLRVP
jgi:hypothetical protein